MSIPPRPPPNGGDLMARQSNDALANDVFPLVVGAPLEPIRVVKRELVRPDGTTIEVEVPVYPPFRLASGREAEREESAPERPRCA